MGQSQSQSTKNGTSISQSTSLSSTNSGSPQSKNKRKSSSSKTDSHSNSSIVNQAPPNTLVSSKAPTTTLPSPPPPPQPSPQTTVTHRGSLGVGGERSAPSRQFSLTRQTSSHQSTLGKHVQIEKYFNKYKDGREDSILAEGMEKFCVDLGVDPTEFIVLVIAWKFEASQMCRFTREEFMNGCQKMQAHNAKSLKERFTELLAEAKDKKNFRDLYNFTFSFGLDHSSGQRSLPIDMALPLWDLVFTQDRPVVLDQWFDFLKDNDIKGISRDTWNMFLPFVETILPNLSNYDESEAWPSLFDDFVEGEQERTTL